MQVHKIYILFDHNGPLKYVIVLCFFLFIFNQCIFKELLLKECFCLAQKSKVIIELCPFLILILQYLWKIMLHIMI